MLTAALNQDATHPMWINQLPDDFYCSPQKLKAKADSGMKLTMMLDLAIRTGLSGWMAGVSFPLGYFGTSLGDTLRGTRSSHHGSDTEVFHQPRPLPAFTVTKARRPKGVKGGIFEEIRWESVYESDYSSHENNNSAVAWYWRHGDQPRPTIVLVHGFLAPWWEVNEFYLGSQFLFDLGCDVVLKTLPHHGPRSRKSKNVSGMDFFSRGIDSLNHAVVQSTYDIRSLVDFLEQRDVEDIGISGVSLGGYTTALMAGLEDRFKFALPLVPLVSLADAMMEWKPLDSVLKFAMRHYRVSMTDVRATIALHSPLSRPVLLPPERLMIIGGMGDLLASPRHAETLQEHWGNCEVHWHPGSHAIPRKHAETNQAKKSFLEKIGFIEA